MSKYPAEKITITQGDKIVASFNIRIEGTLDNKYNLQGGARMKNESNYLSVRLVLSRSFVIRTIQTIVIPERCNQSRYILGVVLVFDHLLHGRAAFEDLGKLFLE